MYQFVYSIFLVSVIMSLILMTAVYAQKASTLQKIMQLIAVCNFLMCFGYFSLMSATTLEYAIFATKITYLGGAPVFLIFTQFCLTYLNVRVPRFLNVIAAVYQSLMMVVILTFDLHSLFFKNIQLTVKNGIPSLSKEYGFVAVLFIIQISLCFLISLYFIIRHLTQNQVTKRELVRVMCLIASLVIATLGYCSTLLVSWTVSLTPFGLTVAAILLTILVKHMNICNVKQEAREYLFDSITNGIIIVNDNYTYEDANSLAIKMFPELKQCKRMKKIDEVSLFLADLFYQGKTKIIEFNKRLYQPEITKVTNSKYISGYMATLVDVTEQQMCLRLMENYQKDLERDVLKQKSQIERMQQQIIVSFANIAESRDGTTGKHIKRTSAYVELICKELRQQNLFEDLLTEEYSKFIDMGAPLHDIGKVMISDEILCKPGKLTKKEFEVIKTHTILGGKILDDTLAAIEGESYLNVAKDMALYHHERWDGTGYPYQLKEDEIPLCARIMAVADVFDALVSERPYKKAFSMDEAFGIIKTSRETHFDPQIVDAFLNIRNEIEEVFTNIFENDEDDGNEYQKEINKYLKQA